MEEQQVTISQQSISTPSKKFPWKKLILSLLVLVFLAAGTGSILAWKTTYLDEWLPQNIKEMFGRRGKVEEEPEEKPEEKAPYAGKLAFLQDGEVWVIGSDGTGKEKITETGGKIKLFHFSPDGKKLGYILQKTFKNKEGNKSLMGYKLILLDLLTKKEEVIVKSLPEEYISDFPAYTGGWVRGLHDFSFSHNGTKIAYTREGTWVLDLSTGESEKIQKVRCQLGPDVPGVGKWYDTVEWSPGDKKILVRCAYFEGASWEGFNPDGSNPQGIGFAYIGGTSTDGFIDDDSLLQSGYTEDEFGHISWVSLTDLQKKNTILKIEPVFDSVYYSQALGKVVFSVSNSSLFIEKPQSTFQLGQLYAIKLSGEEVVELMSSPFEPPKERYTLYIQTIEGSPQGKLGLILAWYSDQTNKYDPEEVWVVDPETKTRKNVAQAAKSGVNPTEFSITQIEWSPE